MTSEAKRIDLRRYLRPGDTVLVGQGTSEPRTLVESLIEQRFELAPLRVFIGASFTGLFRPEHAGPLKFVSYGAVGRTAALARAGVLSIIPLHIGTLPSLIRERTLRIDAVLAQVGEPDREGNHSLGLVSDYLPAAIGCARVTIVEVNARVPFTGGDSIIRAEQIAATVQDDRPLVTVDRRPSLPEDEAIGRLVAELVPDGATLQFGIGGTPDATLAHLRGRKDLGVHSGLISDALLDLIEAGAVTNGLKEIDRGLTVTGALFGSDRLYRWANRNVTLAMRSLDYTHHPRVLAALESLHAINSAVEVDLTGQINGEFAGGRYIGTVGGQGAFARAAITSARGRSIVALPSTANGGAVSRIVSSPSGAITSTSRADADVVVTEHGVAHLRGATLEERIRRMIAIAAPAHREDLGRAASNLFA